MAHQVLVPPLGQTTDTVVLTTWYKQVGDSVKEGEPLFAIETDKATLDIEAQASGILVQSNAQAGDNVVVLSAIGVIAAPGEQGSGGGAASEQRSRGAEEKGRGEGEEALQRREGGHRWVSERVSERDTRVPRSKSERRGRVFISPRARRLAETEGMEWQSITGTGPEGAIVERDIRQFAVQIASPEVAESVEGDRSKVGTLKPEATPISQPMPVANPGWLATEVDASAIMMLRERLNRQGMDVSMDSILVYILAYTLKQRPGFDMAATGISIAIVMAAAQTFVRPVLHDLQRKRLSEISCELAGLTARVHSGSLSPDDSKDAKFAYVNLGAFGIDTYSPPLNAEGVPVLGVGRIRRQAAGHEMMWLSLSFGGSGLDPLAAVRLLQAVAQMIEDPDLLF